MLRLRRPPEHPPCPLEGALLKIRPRTAGHGEWATRRCKWTARRHLPVAAALFTLAGRAAVGRESAPSVLLIVGPDVFKKRPTNTKKRRPKQGNRAPGADELILMRRFPEAEVALRALLKEQRDPQWRLKLADVLRELGRGDEAVTEYLHASDAFLEDGFTDRAHAAAMRARKLVPGRADIEARFQRLEHRKRLDFLRRGAVEALEQAARTEDGHVSTARIELEQIWDKLSETDFVRECEPHQLIRLIGRMKLRRVGEGKRIIRWPMQPVNSGCSVEQGPRERFFDLPNPRGLTDTCPTPAGHRAPGFPTFPPYLVFDSETRTIP